MPDPIEQARAEAAALRARINHLEATASAIAPQETTMSTPLEQAKQARARLAAIPTESAQMIRTYREQRARLEGSLDLGPDAKRSAVAKLRAEHTARAAELVARAEAAGKDFTTALSRARRKPTPVGPAEQLGWERLRLALDGLPRDANAAMAAEQRLSRAAEDGDAGMLAAARLMLPDWLASRGEGLPPHLSIWLDARSPDPEIVAAAGLALDRSTSHGPGWVLGAARAAAGEIGDMTGERSTAIIPTFEGGTVELGDAPDYRAIRHGAVSEQASVLAAAGYRPTTAGSVERTGGRGPAQQGAGGADTAA